MYIKSLNFSYMAMLRNKNIDYFNSYAQFIDKNTLKLISSQNKEEIIESDNFLISTGGRPTFLDLPGEKENCITSDDIFWKKNNPGKTLIVGSGYIGLECAGFINSLGNETKVLLRSRVLR